MEISTSPDFSRLLRLLYTSRSNVAGPRGNSARKAGSYAQKGAQKGTAQKGTEPLLSQRRFVETA